MTALLALLVIPAVSHLYTAWSGDGTRGFLFRGLVAAVCLIPPTVLMGATLPALSRCAVASWLGFLYAGNIAGAICGCLIAGFYLLRQYDAITATCVAAGLNAVVAGTARLLASRIRQTVQLPPSTPSPQAINENTVDAVISLSPCPACAQWLQRPSGLVFWDCCWAAPFIPSRLSSLYFSSDGYT